MQLCGDAAEAFPAVVGPAARLLTADRSAVVRRIVASWRESGTQDGAEAASEKPDG